MIPQSNPKAGYLARKEEINTAVTRVLESGWYVLGEEVTSFETAFAHYLGSSYGAGVANGTDALELALRACGVAQGDFVITVSHTAVATASAISRIGAYPLFVDIDPNRFTMDPNQLEDLLKHWKGNPLKAVLPVHLYGQPADMVSIMSVAQRYGLRVVEDCAQAHGAKIGDQCVGTWGDAGAFSFYPTKNLGAFGDAGIVVTNDSQLNEKITLLREYGWRRRYVSDFVGVNSRLDTLQAAILKVQLPSLDESNASRSSIAVEYTKKLQQNPKFECPKVADGTSHVFHQYVIRTTNRNKLQIQLKERGVGSLVHYPFPIHQQRAYSNPKFRPFSLYHTEKAVDEILSLPMFPQLTTKDLQIVCEHLIDLMIT